MPYPDLVTAERSGGSLLPPRLAALVLVALAAGLLLTADSAVADSRLVADIDTTATGSRPTSFVGLGDHVIFDATTYRYGRELHISDGTAEGTRVLIDIDPGLAGSYPDSVYDRRPVVVAGNRVFFAASVDNGADMLWASRPWGPGFVEDAGIEPLKDQLDEILGVWGDHVVFTRLGAYPKVELWTSDGTAEGTRILGVFGDGIWPREPDLPIVFGDRLLLSARTDATGREPWAIDLETAEITLLADIYAGERNGVVPPAGWRILGDRVFFVGRTVAAGAELWSTDGTVEGTALFFDLRPGEASSYPSGFRRVGARLFFAAKNETGIFDRLFVTDGTAAGTAVIEPAAEGFRPDLGNALDLDGRLLFAAWDNLSGKELWISDGTAAGTRQVVDLRQGPSDGNPDVAVAWQRPGEPTQIVFRFFDFDYGEELWITDGTTAGTRLLADLRPGIESSYPEVTAIGGKLFIAADDGLIGPEPWVADSSSNGVRLLADVDTGGSEGSYPFALQAAGDRLYFLVREPREDGEVKVPRLWSTDGTTAGTGRVVGAEALERIDFSTARQRGDQLYFAASDASFGRELFRLEAGSKGPPTVIDLLPGAAGSSPARLTAAGDELFYTRDVDGALELWRLGPGETGIHLGDFLPAPDPDASGFGTERSSTAGRVEQREHPADRSDTTKGPYFEPDPIRLHPWAENLAVFVLDEDGDGSVSREEEEWLWISDGTARGTRRLARVSHIGDHASPPVALGDRLLFPAWDEEHGQELWVSDGTADGTGLLRDLEPGPDGSRISGLIATADHAYFTATNGQGQLVLWRTDGTVSGTEELLAGRVGQLFALGETVFFELHRPFGSDFWRVVGEPVRIEQFTFPELHSFHTLTWLGAEGGLAYFAADSACFGRELFATDGTASGTRRVTDVAPGRLSSRPGSPVRLGGDLFFPADDGVHGDELWATEIECLASTETVCLGEGRFQARARWQHGAGTDRVADRARSSSLTEGTAGFWFFDPENVEMAVKVLDGTATNAHFWVYMASLSNVEFELDVFDTVTGNSRSYRNPDGTFASFGDVLALPSSPVAAVTPERPGSPSASPSATAAAAASATAETRAVPLVFSAPKGTAETGPCIPSAEVLCLDHEPGDGRFALRADWRDFAGRTGVGTSRRLTAETGGFWFFDPANIELLVKVLDARASNGYFWVFLGSLSNVEFELKVMDTETGAEATYFNRLGDFASFGDMEALPE